MGTRGTGRTATGRSKRIGTRRRRCVRIAPLRGSIGRSTLRHRADLRHHPGTAHRDIRNHGERGAPHADSPVFLHDMRSGEPRGTVERTVRRPRVGQHHRPPCTSSSACRVDTLGSPRTISPTSRPTWYVPGASTRSSTRPPGYSMRSLTELITSRASFSAHSTTYPRRRIRSSRGFLGRLFTLGHHGLTLARHSAGDSPALLLKFASASLNVEDMRRPRLASANLCLIGAAVLLGGLACSSSEPTDGHADDTDAAASSGGSSAAGFGGSGSDMSTGGGGTGGSGLGGSTGGNSGNSGTSGGSSGSAGGSGGSSGGAGNSMGGGTVDGGGGRMPDGGGRLDGAGGGGGAGGSMTPACGAPAPVVFTKNIRVNDDTGNGNQAEVTLATGPDGLAIAAWGDSRGERTCTFSVSKDGGVTWGRTSPSRTWPANSSVIRRPPSMLAAPCTQSVRSTSTSTRAWGTSA